MPFLNFCKGVHNLKNTTFRNCFLEYLFTVPSLYQPINCLFISSSPSNCEYTPLNNLTIFLVDVFP
nr:hypothetical protein Iba_chr05cCG9090 [Ipomoea batatas]